LFHPHPSKVLSLQEIVQAKLLIVELLVLGEGDEIVGNVIKRPREGKLGGRGDDIVAKIDYDSGTFFVNSSHIRNL
jgi:hypothetical protein